MDCYITVHFSPFPSEKPPAVESPIQAILGNTQVRWTPAEWHRVILHYDARRRYVVTQLSQYRERPPWLDCQHEYVTLAVQPRPSSSQPQPPEAPTVIKVSRSIRGDACLARLGIYGTADDTISILGHGTTVRIPHQRVNHLAWPAEQAPSLAAISTLILSIHQCAPSYNFLLKTSCYAFARAVIKCIHIAYDGAAEQDRTRFLASRSYLLSVPVGITRAQAMARIVAIVHISNRELSLARTRTEPQVADPLRVDVAH